MINFSWYTYFMETKIEKNKEKHAHGSQKLNGMGSFFSLASGLAARAAVAADAAGIPAAVEPPLVLVTATDAAAAVSRVAAVLLAFKLPVLAATASAAAPSLISRAHSVAIAEILP